MCGDHHVQSTDGLPLFFKSSPDFVVGNCSFSVIFRDIKVMEKMFQRRWLSLFTIKLFEKDEYETTFVLYFIGASSFSLRGKQFSPAKHTGYSLTADHRGCSGCRYTAAKSGRQL